VATGFWGNKTPKPNAGGWSQNRCVDLIAVKFSISQNFPTISASPHQLYVSFIGTQLSVVTLLGLWEVETLQGCFPGNSGGGEMGPCNGCMLHHLLEKSSAAHQHIRGCGEGRATECLLCFSLQC